MKQKAMMATYLERSKAFLIDLFLIYVPILYFCYFVFGKNEFLNNQFIIFSCVIIFGLIQAIFLNKKLQSPGLKAYDLFLVEQSTGKKVGFLKLILRYVFFLVGFAFVFGIMISFFRKDHLFFHDLLSKTYIIRKV